MGSDFISQTMIKRETSGAQTRISTFCTDGAVSGCRAVGWVLRRGREVLAGTSETSAIRPGKRYGHQPVEGLASRNLQEEKCCNDGHVAELVYLDETGSVGRGARNQPYLTLVAVVVDEAAVQPLADRLRQVAAQHLGFVPSGFEFHANEIWNAQGHWSGMSPPALLAVLDDLIHVLDELSISVVHASIDKAKLSARHAGAYDDNAYVLALQFLLEKLDRWRTDQALRIIIADEAKEHQLRAVNMVREMQKWAAGAVPGRRLVSVIDSMHFVDSKDSPGVQLADIVAFMLHRARLSTQGHPDADAAVSRLAAVIGTHTPTYRWPWPS